jgi:hypothetical protein
MLAAGAGQDGDLRPPSGYPPGGYGDGRAFRDPRLILSLPSHVIPGTYCEDSLQKRGDREREVHLHLEVLSVADLEVCLTTLRGQGIMTEAWERGGEGA